MSNSESSEPTPTLVIPTMDVPSPEDIDESESRSNVYYIYPLKRTSRLGVTLLILGLLAFVPFITYCFSRFPSENAFQPIITWAVCFITTFIPITLYLILQTSNKIGISIARGVMSYQSAIGTSVSTIYTDKAIDIVYFSNTSAQGKLNRKGWVGFYNGKKLIFRLNMERWDIEDLRWLSKVLPARMVVISERKSAKYVEKRFKGYFPMYASDPVTSGALIIIGVLGGIFIEFILWSIAFHFLGF